jgi:hypothetical protein
MDRTILAEYVRCPHVSRQHRGCDGVCSLCFGSVGLYNFIQVLLEDACGNHYLKAEKYDLLSWDQYAKRSSPWLSPSPAPETLANRGHCAVIDCGYILGAVQTLQLVYPIIHGRLSLTGGGAVSQPDV